MHLNKNRKQYFQFHLNVVRPEESVLDADFADLRHFREQVGKDFRVWSIVLYAGREVKCYGEGEIALPMAYLWL